LAKRVLRNGKFPFEVPRVIIEATKVRPTVRTAALTTAGDKPALCATLGDEVTT
jgi:hypothetical protein